MIYIFSVGKDCTNPRLISKYVHLASPSYSLYEQRLPGNFVPSHNCARYYQRVRLDPYP